MKYGRYLLVALVAFIGIIFTDVSASTMNKTPFKITANYSWGTDNTNGARKLFSSRSSAVQWQTSSKSSSHKMIFRIKDGSGNEYGKSTLSYLTTGSFRTDLTLNGSTIYVLSARRENLIDPTTTVSGMWLP